MSAAAPVTALFEESCGGRVASAGGGVYADGAPPPRVAANSTSPDVKEEDPLLRRFVDAAQELVVPEGELASVKELAFAFQRAASRLIEVKEMITEKGRLINGCRVVLTCPLPTLLLSLCGWCPDGERRVPGGARPGPRPRVW